MEKIRHIKNKITKYLCLAITFGAIVLALDTYNPFMAIYL